jgi:hypothetical protein
MLSSFSYKEFYGEDDLGSRGKRLDFFGKRFGGIDGWLYKINKLTN